jgi:hypothetical protein
MRILSLGVTGGVGSDIRDRRTGMVVSLPVFEALLLILRMVFS